MMPGIMERTDADAVVAGGGIGGAFLAALLGRAGRKVLVLEKGTGPPSWTRPEILWPATARSLMSILPDGAFEREAGVLLEGISFFDGGRFVPGLTADLFEAAGVRPWSTDPNRTREMLLGLGGFEVRRGVEVTGLLRERGRVVGVRAREASTGRELHAAARWTIGDDGAGSLVRRECGIRMRLRTFPMDFFCFPFDWPRSFPRAVGRVWPDLRNPGSGIVALAALPVPGGKGAGLLAVRRRVLEAGRSLEGPWAEFVRLPGVAEVVGGRTFPADFVRVRRPWGHAARYGVPGALLLGDAAHPVSPFGGQGGSCAIADARVLAASLLEGADPLIRYERLRRPANARSLGPTRLVAALQGLPGRRGPTSLFFALAGWAGRRPSLLRRALRYASTAFLEDR